MLGVTSNKEVFFPDKTEFTLWPLILLHVGNVTVICCDKYKWTCIHPPPTHTHTQQLPVNTNLFDTFGNHAHGLNSGGGASPIVMPQISASCPANVKEENMMAAGGLKVSGEQ